MSLGPPVPSCPCCRLEAKVSDKKLLLMLMPPVVEAVSDDDDDDKANE
jgi:hypothetical protein